jgi:ABC-type transport system involved in multi-copper enzyme maturation permease subunit
MKNEIIRVFSFYFYQARKTSRTKTFFWLSTAAILMALVIRAYKIAGNWTESGQVIFQNFLMTFFLQFLIVLMALFFGTAIVGEELDNRTMPYLTSRPLARPAIILGKFLAYFCLSGLMLLLSVLISYLILNLDSEFSLSSLGTVLSYSLVLLLGLAAYLSFFNFLGVWLKKPVLVGLAFGFGWESIIQYFPGTTQKLSIVHYLKSLLPRYTTSSGKLGFLFIRLEPTKPWLAILVLFAVVAVFLLLSCVLFSYKEYLYED